MKLKPIISALLFTFSFKSHKCKVALKLVMARIKLLRNKREVEVRQMRIDLAKLLEMEQHQTALIRVEHVIREENTMAAYDLIDIYCGLVVAHMDIINSQKKCPIDLKEAISSVVFASARCADIPELMDIYKHFMAKYGKEFTTAALEVRPECGVSRLVVEKLSANAADIDTKIKVLTEIAFDHNIKWDPKAFEEQIRKPNDDLLTGPNTFTGASKMTMESYTLKSPSAQSWNNEQPTHASENFVTNSQTMPNAKLQTSTMTFPSRGSEKVGYAYPELKNASFSHSGWNMEFKDVVSAALAAAESADRASMAAKTAARLANRGAASVQTSEGPKSGTSYQSFESLQRSSIPENSATMSRHPIRNLDGKVISKSREPYRSPEEPPVEQLASVSLPVKGTEHMQSSLPENGENKETESSTVKQPSRENSLKNASHVHPKLPDYETFAAYFRSLRTNVRPK